MDLSSTYWPQSLCLFSQFIITTIAIIRILDNSSQFPIRQLGPKSTIICLLCFLLSNILSLFGRVLAQSQPLLHSQCAIYHSNLLYTLSIFYNLTRQLPFPLLTLKILRVSLCFWPKFNKINVERIPRWFVWVLRDEGAIVFVCLVYVGIVGLMVRVIGGVGDQTSYMCYEYFCPKQRISVVEQIVGGIRFIGLVFVFYLSLYTYDELDFKKFLILIFLSSSLSIVPHLAISFGRYVMHNPILSRSCIYYTSYLISLSSSLIFLYFSGINRQLTQPAMQGVLQSWQAFHNLKLGMVVLLAYAQYRDLYQGGEGAKGGGYSYRCLESYDFLDQLLRTLMVNREFEVRYYLEVVEKILERNEYVRMKLGNATTEQYKKRCADGTLPIDSIKRIQKILQNYCETVIFADWKKTKSYKFLKQQFINNGDINEKLGLFQIPVS